MAIAGRCKQLFSLSIEKLENPSIKQEKDVLTGFDEGDAWQLLGSTVYLVKSSYQKAVRETFIKSYRK